MSDSVLTLDEVLEEIGLVAKWEARGRAEGEARGEARGRAEGEARGRNEERQYFLDLLDQGLSVEEIKQRLAEDK